jgi:hypothetical protein
MGESPLAKDDYLAVQAFWIDGTADAPNDWKIHSQAIGFTHVQGRHNAVNISKVIFKLCDSLGIVEKVSQL